MEPMIISTLDLRSEATRRCSSHLRNKQISAANKVKQGLLRQARPAWRPSSANAESRQSRAPSTNDGNYGHELDRTSVLPLKKRVGHTHAQNGSTWTCSSCPSSNKKLCTPGPSPPVHATDKLPYTTMLEEQLRDAMADLGAVCEHCDWDHGGAPGSSSRIFNVVLSAGRLGMVVTVNRQQQVMITELKRDQVSGTPLLALGCGELETGDIVLALNGEPLAILKDLQQVALAFSQAKRPLTLLVKRESVSQL